MRRMLLQSVSELPASQEARSISPPAATAFILTAVFVGRYIVMNFLVAVILNAFSSANETHDETTDKLSIKETGCFLSLTHGITQFVPARVVTHES